VAGEAVTEPATRRERRRAESESAAASVSRTARSVATRQPAPSQRSLLGHALPPLLALLLTLWTLTCLVGVASTGLSGLAATGVATLASAAPLVTLLAVAVVTLAARRRSWVAVVLASLAGLMPWVFVAPYASGDDAPTAAGAATLRVMVINAHQGRASAHDIVAATTGNEVDLLVVTELSGQLAHDLTAAGLDRTVTARWVRLPGQDDVSSDPEAGMGVWGRVELTQAADVPGTQWPAMQAQVRAGATSFTLIAGHVAEPFPGDGQRWAQELSTLRGVAASANGSKLLLANLNATPWHADFRRMSDAGLRDAADALGRGPRATWPTWSPVPVLSLDHAMVGGGIGVDSVETVVIGGSDHRGLLAVLRLPAA
jgi:endonuclease/exonuclease/phosphatase (EEP) superfamily protein YafD